MPSPLKLDEKKVLATFQRTRNIAETCAEMKCHHSIIRRILDKHKVARPTAGRAGSPDRALSKIAAPKGLTKSAIKTGGMEALKTLFGKEEITRRRTSRIQEKVENFINTTLKQRQWMPDADVRMALGLSSLDFTMIRRNYEALLMEPIDENRRKVLIWVHPDHAETAQDVINGTT